jgi:hypothetical protein
MVEQVEIKDDGLTETQQQSTLDKSTTERPSWLPEKFESAEEMAKSYAELEKVYSEKKEEAPVEQKEAEEATGISLDPYYKEYADTGVLSDKSYTDLQVKGLSKELIDNYISGQKALADNQLSQIYNIAGTQENYNEMVKWAGENLPATEVHTFIMAASGLKARYDNSVGVAPNLVKGGISTTTNAFQSTAEIIAAINDPRYQVDTAYRKGVEDKIKRSNAIG